MVVRYSRERMREYMREYRKRQRIVKTYPERKPGEVEAIKQVLLSAERLRAAGVINNRRGRDVEGS